MQRQIAVSAAARETHLRDHIYVQRALPNPELGAIGPYVFFDHLDRMTLSPDRRLFVPPHPHAGLQVVTYLFSGALQHRDSLSNRSVARPGELHWLTAGRGVVHSEESYFTAPEDSQELELLQIWCRIPAPLQYTEPGFAHYAASVLPVITLGDAKIRVIAGVCGDTASPVRSASPNLFLDLDFPAGGNTEIPVDPSFELGLYVVEGHVSVGGREVLEGQLARLEDGGDKIALVAAPGSRAVIVGGEPLSEPPVIQSGFTLSSSEEIADAQRAYKEGRFGTIP